MNGMSAPSTPKFLQNKPSGTGPATTPAFNRLSMNYPPNDVSPPRSMGSPGRATPRFSPPINTAYGTPPGSQSYGSAPQGDPFRSRTGPPSFINASGRPGIPPSSYSSPYGNGNSASQRRFSTDQQSSSPRTPAWAQNGISPPGPHSHPPPAPHLGGPPPPPNFGGPPNMGGPPSSMPPPPGSGGPQQFGSNRFGMNRSMSQSSNGSYDSINLNAPPMQNSFYNQVSPPQSPAMNDRFARFQQHNNPPAAVPPPINNGPRAPPIPATFKTTPPGNTPTASTRSGGGLLSEIASGRTALRSANTRELKKPPPSTNTGSAQNDGDMLNLLRQKLNVRNAQVADDSDDEWSSSDG